MSSIYEKNWQAIKENEERVAQYNNGRLYGGQKGDPDRTALDPWAYHVNHQLIGTRGPVTGSGGAAAPAAAESAPDYSGLVHSLQDSLREALKESLALRREAYRESKRLYTKNLNSRLGQLKDTLKFGEGKVNENADNSLRQAWLTRMDSLRTLPQLLSAQGLTGGMTETTNARLLNAYGNHRNSIEGERAGSLRQLLHNYQQGEAQAQQAFNEQLAQAYSDMKKGMAADRAAYEKGLAQLGHYLH